MPADAPPTTRQRPLALTAALGLAASLVGTALLLAAPASAQDSAQDGAQYGAQDRAPEPKLSISVDNGRTSAEAGDKLDYTISVENVGVDAVSGLRVSQTMPPGLVFGSADREGTVRKSTVVWAVDLKPGGTRTLHTSMKVGATPDEVLRMATVACAGLTAKTPPIVCATHSDELPAGALAAEATGTASGTDDGSALRPLLLAGLLSVGALVAGFAVVTYRRRAGHGTTPGSHAV